MPKAIFIILTLSGFASGAELEVTDRLSVLSTAVFSGSVGIGTTNPTGKLYVSTGAGTANLFIDSTTGNVGIGTASPGTKLDVAGRARITELQLNAPTTAGYILTSDANGIATWQAGPLPASLQQGDLAYYDGANWARLPAGTAGQTLKVAFDSSTKLLLHGDGNDGATAFTDEIGKNVTNTETYDAYTKLMIHMEGITTSFVDSATSKTVSANGNATQTTSQHKFGTQSGVFGGTGDYLSIPDSDDWCFGSGDFTIDFWVRFNSLSGVQFLAAQVDTIGGYGAWWNLQKETDAGGGNKLSMVFVNGTFAGPRINVGQYRMANDWSVSTGVWYHLTFERAGTTGKIFVDGVEQSISEYTAFGTNTLDNKVGALLVGESAGSGACVNGWIDEFRVTKGIARWNSNFAPPVQPYGQVRISTSKKEFGTASMLFDGSGSYLSLTDSADFTFDGDFTIDFWLNLALLPSLYPLDTYMLMSQCEDGTNYWYLSVAKSGDNCVFNSQWIKSYPTNYFSHTSIAVSLTAGIWYHVAFVKNGVNYYWFVNGVDKSGTPVVILNPFVDITAPLEIGRWNETGAKYYLPGSIDELRISKGIARWTSNFTPPTSPYNPMPNWSGP